MSASLLAMRLKSLSRDTRYFSPYPLIENETDDVSVSSSSAAPPTKIPGVSRATIRSHGRTSDLLAGGLGRNHTKGKNAILWVCEMCFKYMADGLSWELHNVRWVSFASYLLCPDAELEIMHPAPSSRKEGIPTWSTYYLGGRRSER